MTKRIANPKLFRELNEPFESSEKANEALTAFYDELGELRKKYKLPNVLVVIQGSALDSNGEEGEWMTQISYGDALREEPMAAYAYGRAQKDREELMARALKGGR